MVPAAISRSRLSLAVGLVVATFAAYLPAWHGQFLWDDDSWTTLIADLLRDSHGLWQMWTQPAALQQYYPLIGTTFWLDAHLWQSWTLPYHLENIALHTAAALLFWQLLRQLSVPGAPLAAAIFALHPVMVESVAWITERKNVLSLPLYLASLLCYARFTCNWQPTPATPTPHHARWYAAALGLFLAALTAKVTAFSLPAVALLLCWWRTGRIRWRADVLPLLPFFALSVLFGLAVSTLERQHLGAQGADFAFTPAERCLIAGRVLWFYPAKLLWPAYQCFVYPRWTLDTHSPAQWLYPVTALAALLILWLTRHRLGRGPATAIFFYAGTLFPVTGLLNGYFMRYSFVWDHLVYLSSLGLITLLAATLTRAAHGLRLPRLPATFAAVTLPLLAALTWQQSAMYQNNFTLYRTTIRQNPACWLACDNLGSALMSIGHADEAVTLYQRSIALRPDNAEAHNNLANAFARTNRPAPALAQYRAALALNPTAPAIHANLAAVLAQTGQLDEAIVHYRQATNTGRDRATALTNLAAALLQHGDHREGAARLSEALVLRPDDPSLANDLAFLLATTSDPTLRDAPRALALIRRLDTRTHHAEPLILRTLAAAASASGDFSTATTTATHALEIATTRQDTPLTAALRDDLQLYASRTPLTTPAVP